MPANVQLLGGADGGHGAGIGEALAVAHGDVPDSLIRMVDQAGEVPAGAPAGPETQLLTEPPQHACSRRRVTPRLDRHVIGVDITTMADDQDTRVERVQCDLSDPASVERCFVDITDRHGGVDILVNNAALASEIKPQPFDQITPETWTRVITVNTMMPFLCSRAVVPYMRAQKWGRIVNITSATIFLGTPYNLHYIASKGAVAVMTRALAKELGADGINVNAIAPGMTITDGIRKNAAYSEEMLAGTVSARVLQREEGPDDLVGACLFLVGQGADFMTGQILTVDGGVAFH